MRRSAAASGPVSLLREARVRLSPLKLVLAVGAIVAALTLAPWIADRLDRVGAPGGPIVLGAIFAIAAYCLVVGLSLETGGRRRRTMQSLASAHGWAFRSSFRAPDSLRELPAFVDLGFEGGVENLIVVPDDPSPILLFDRWQWPDVGYEPIRRFTFAAMEVPVAVPRLVVVAHGVPRPTSHEEIEAGPAAIISELPAFDRRYHVRAWDRLAASAFLDTRMLAWLAEVEGDWCFEAGGSWIACSSHDLGRRQVDELLSALEGFRAHLPRVLGSLYPRSDPGRW